MNDIKKEPRVKINMLEGKYDSASAVIEIDGQVSVISNYDILPGTSPGKRESLLIDRAFYLQGKERPANDE